MRTRQLFVLVGLGVLIANAASARGRDDVMSGAYRCAVISDDRQWLDCYYGAAQPVRAELGLPSAPVSQLNLANAPPRGGESANTKIRDEALASAGRCYVLTDDRRWLDCFYGAAQPVRSLLGLAPAKQASVVPSEPTPVESNIGLRPQKKSSKDEGIISSLFGKSETLVTSRLTSYRFDPYGIFTVELANGQVWQQLSGDTSYARWTAPATKYAVSIRSGALGSFLLSVPNEGRSYKVRRVK